MAWWSLTVKTPNGEHKINVGKDEAQALKALDDAKRNIGKSGVVTIADRLALKAEDIISVEIAEHGV
jgi:hypothetical protein